VIEALKDFPDDVAAFACHGHLTKTDYETPECARPGTRGEEGAQSMTTGCRTKTGVSRR
jgi:hypothetical protein